MHLDEAKDADLILAEGYDVAYVGVVEVDGTLRALYDRALIIDLLMDRDGMDEEEAEEFFEFNVAGSYVGPAGPVYASFARKESHQ